MKTDKTELFETKPIPKAVAELAVPTIMSTLVMMLYNLADTYFVGMLNNPVQNAAVTLAAPVMLAFNAVNNLFGVGASSVMSRALGRKDYDMVARASGFSFYCALICSLAISALYIVFRFPLLELLGADETTRTATAEYMRWTVAFGACPAIMNIVLSYMIRSEGFALFASVGMMGGCLINILLDPFFILPQYLNLGAAGAGLATFTANTLAFIYFIVLVLLRRGSTHIKLYPKYLKSARKVSAEVFGIGIPASIQNLLNVTGMTILNNFTSAYGSDAVAAMGIAHKVNMLPLYLCMGISQGVMPLISYNYTSGDHRRLKDSVSYVAKLSLSLALVLSALMFLSAGNVIRLFIETENVVAYGSRFLRSMCVGIPFLAVDFFSVAIFQALGKGKYSLVFALLRKIILEIPFIILLNTLYPLYGMAFAQTAAEIVLSTAAVIVLFRLFGKIKT